MILRCIVLILSLLIGESCKAGWIELEPLTKQNDNSALADIISQCPQPSIYRGDSDSNTGHESCHGVHSRMRNNLDKRYDNGYYLLKGRGFVISSPNFKLIDVARAIPADKRGNDYNLYLVKASQGGINGWNDTPFYIIDELIAYVNGTIISLSVPETAKDAKLCAVTSYENMLEMWEYTKVAQELARKSGFAEQKELDEFLDFVYNNRILWLEKEFKKRGWFKKISPEAHRQFL